MNNAESPLRVLFIAAEAVPFSKVGGLADVAGALPKALARLGHDVRVVTPLHNPLEQEGSAAEVETTLSIPFLGNNERVEIRKAPLGSATAYLVENRRYFSRPSVYGERDDIERYRFFCQAALELPKALGWQPQIYHCHDWHTAMVPFGLRSYRWRDPFYRRASSILTIHNLRYRGPDDFIDFLCQGILYADRVTTVSETYAKEILTPEFGEGLQELLSLRRDKLGGIINGLDYEEYNPATDSLIPSRYDAGSLEGKRPNKSQLQQRTGLSQDENKPLIGMVTRLTEQKGIDIALEAMAQLVSQSKAQFALLGLGDDKYQRQAQGLAEKYPNQVRVILGFDTSMAQLIYAGSDMFLMPSRFEPCGLGQMIAMRYGTIPVVRATGGLVDTVTPFEAGKGKGRGFLFSDYSYQALLGAMESAIEIYKTPALWRSIMQRAMTQDFSWGASALKYQELYYQSLI